MKFLTLLFLLISVANAQFLPPTRIQGDADASLTPFFNLILPYNQATKTSSVGFRIETGSENILANPSFEHLTVATGWTNANGTAAAETSIVQDGSQALSVTLSSQSLDLTQEFVAGSSNYDEAYNNSNPSFSCYINASSAVELCFTFGSSEVTCKAYDTTTGKIDTWQRLEAQGYVASGTNFGVKLKSSSISDVVYVDNCEFNPVVNHVETQKQKVFGARIANNGTATIVSQGGKNESGQNAIASVNRNSSGNVTITWTAGFFTVAPSVVPTVAGVTGNAFAMVDAVSTTDVVIIVDEDAGSATDHDFNIVITRQGSDAEGGDENLMTALKSNITEWTSYTPTFTGFGTATNVEFYWKRIGSDLHVRGYFTGGTHTATEARISFPSGLTSSSNINASVEPVGMMNSTQTTANRQFSVLAEQSVTYFTFNRADTSNQTMNKVLGTNLSAGGSNWSFFARVPIDGWDSSAEFLGAVPINQTCYVRDEKTSGTSGGTCTSGSWQVRDLNTTTGDCWFLSLNSNVFTLSPGKYEISGSAPAGIVNSHQTKIVQDPSGSPSDLTLGTIEESGSTDSVQSRSFFETSVTLTASTDFRLEHRCSVTKATNGFGDPGSFGTEVYSIMKITRVRP